MTSEEVRMRAATWLKRHDPDYSALRRAGRAAIVMPLLFAFGGLVLHDPQVATFAAFGSFAMLLLVDFTGPLVERVQAQLALAVVGAVLVCLGTLASRPVWLSAVAMAVVAFAVLFAGSVSSVTASASTSLLLAFILPVTLPGTVASLGPRLLGWGFAAAGAVVALVALWPAPAREPLRGPAVDACRALADRLLAEAVAMLRAGNPELAAERDRAIGEADAAVDALHTAFLRTPYRPTGLSTSARTIVRLVDELNWLNSVIAQFDHVRIPNAATPGPVHVAAFEVKSTAAAVLEEGAALLARHGGDPAALERALALLVEARTGVEAATMALPVAADPDGRHRVADDIVTALDPGFRAQELAQAVETVAGNIALTARAERRSWWQRALGRQPGDLAGPVAVAAERASGFIGWNSVWLRNSIRGAIALGLAVLLANLTGVQHSFWVVLGTLSVLRSNALSTGQTVLRGVVGTAVGVLLGAAAMVAIGDNRIVIWFLLPLAILVAGIAPAAISFAAGQAAFTILLVLLFNLIAPSGWTVGLIRIEDIALGCAVSLVVGLLFWPRGAAASLRQALAEAYRESIRYLAATVAFGLGRCEMTAADQPEPLQQALRAVAAARRLDDAFRTYLGERGAKQRPLAEVSASVGGVAGVRLASDAILDLWRRQEIAGEERASARRSLEASVERLDGWYGQLATSLVAREPLPEPVPADPADRHRLADVVADDLGDGTGHIVARAVRIIWTGDYLDVVRRLESVIVGPVHALGDDLAAGRRVSGGDRAG
ncbi:FUSC family protein [Leifsonia shinshuensis]|uniref:FUSC family protein n=1 Tax=Leifsonia shinshuensis TaxID=150026 RepID=UPI0035ED7498